MSVGQKTVEVRSEEYDEETTSSVPPLAAASLFVCVLQKSLVIEYLMDQREAMSLQKFIINQNTKTKNKTDLVVSLQDVP